MTILRSCRLRNRGFYRGAVIVACLLAIAALSPLERAFAGDPPAPTKSNNQTYAVIFGTVWGPDDKPAYGVKVKIRREDEKKARWEVYSDHHGEFAQRVPAGKARYVAWAEMKGAKSRAAIQVEYDERVDTGLHLK